MSLPWQKEGLPVVPDKLSILVHHDQLAAAITDSGALCYFTRSELSAPLFQQVDPWYDFVGKHAPLRASFHEVEIILSDADGVIIPSEFYEQFQEEKYFKWLHRDEKDSTVKTVDLGQGMQSLVRMPQEIYYPLFAKYSEANFKSTFTLMVSRSKVEAGKLLMLTEHNKTYLAYSDAAGNLQGYNRFQTRQTEEVGFFAAAFCEQLKLDRRELEVIWYSKADTDAMTFLQQYLPKLQRFRDKLPPGIEDFPQVFHLL